MKKKLLYYRILEYQQENIDFLNEHFEVIRLDSPKQDSAGVLREVSVILAPLGYYLGKEKIDAASQLEIIASNTTGIPHIDFIYAEKKGVQVISLKDKRDFLSSITSTAEHTWGLILSLTRRVPWAFDSVKKGTWNRRLFGGPSMLSRMTLGIAGLGRLGSMVARYGVCFGMDVQYYDPFVEEAHIDSVRRVKSLKALVSTSDIITIHIPHGPSTANMFNADVFQQFRWGAYLINTSRGELVDHEAMLEALKEGRLTGAGLDVFEGEYEENFAERLYGHPLGKYARDRDNLLITPHIGGSTIDAWRLTEERTIQMILERLDLL